MSAKPETAEERTIALAGEFLVVMVRALRIAAVHDIKNEAAVAVIEDLRWAVQAGLTECPSLQLQSVGDAVYFNNEFVRLRSGAAFEAAIQLRRLFRRLGINELTIGAPLELAEIEAFLLRFQQAMLGNNPKSFATEKFPKIIIRPIEQSRAFSIDHKLELARTYAQLIVVLEEALAAVTESRLVALSRIRRAVQQLAAAAEGQEGLLAGLTRFWNPEGGLPMHGAAVTALVLLMGQRLGAARNDLMGLLMSALFHDLGRASAPPGTEPEPLVSALAIAAFHQPKEAIERCSVALEAPLPASGGPDGLLPGLSSQLVAIACAYDRLVHPGPKQRGLKPDQAVRLLAEHAGGRFDRRVAKLFQLVVGLYPVGSIVRLSGGQKAVVVALPADPALLSRPTVKVYQANGAAADYLLELSAPEETARIVETLDPRDEVVPVTQFLLA